MPGDVAYHEPSLSAVESSVGRSSRPMNTLGPMSETWLDGTQREPVMIFGAHVIVYSRDAPADRAFFRDVLGFSSVDAGHDWLIFALPPAELAVHPAEDNGGHELFLMCDDLSAQIAELREKDVQCSEIEHARWGSVTKIRLPGGGEVGLYQPAHPSPPHVKAASMEDVRDAGGPARR